MDTFERHAQQVTIAGRQLRCQVCEHDRFSEREASLNTSVFGFDWSNTKATCMVCDRCGFVHWFLPTRVRGTAADGELREALEALRVSLEQIDGDAEQLDDALAH